MYFLSVESIRAADARAIAEGTPGTALMERAGYAAMRFLTHVAMPAVQRVLVVCGKGNNAGDACVVARYLFEQGCHVTALCTCSADACGDEAAAQMRTMADAGVPCVVGDTPDAVNAFFAHWQGDVIVDGLLGTGTRGTVTGLYAAVINAMNAHVAPVLALDIPSGMCATTGTACGLAVYAAWTVTFAHPKMGMLTDDAAAYCGRIECVDIGIPTAISERIAQEEKANLCAYTAREIAALLPPRQYDTHKNDFGHLLIVAGSERMSGAAVLCGRAAMAAGAGLVTIAAPARITARIASAAPACMTFPLTDDGKGILTAAGAREVASELERYDAVAVGPGCGRDEETVEALRWLCRTTALPLVCDADGLFSLAQDMRVMTSRAGKATVMTPHAGEFARMMSESGRVTSGQARREAATAFMHHYPESVLVLKGHHTLIAAPDAPLCVTLPGSVALATAGSGDVLTGIIGALLAGGLSARDAACVGAWLHGCAGDCAAGVCGVVSVTAEDIVAHISAAYRYVRGM